MAYVHHRRVRSPIQKVARLRPEDRAKATFHPHSMFRVAEFSGEMTPADPDYMPRGGLDHRSKIRYSSRALKNEVLGRTQPVRSIYENYDDEEDEDSRGRRRLEINDEEDEYYKPHHSGSYKLGSETDFPSNFGKAESRSEAVGRRNGRDGTDRHGVDQRFADIESTDFDIVRTHSTSFLGLERDEFDRRARVGSTESSEARERSHPRTERTGNNDRGYERRVERTMLFPRGRGSFYNCNSYLDSDRPAWNGSSYNCNPRVSSDFSGPREPSYDAARRSYSGRGSGYRDPSYSSVPHAYSEHARGSKVGKSSQNRAELPGFGLLSTREHERRTSSELFYTDRYPSESKRSSRRSQVNDLSRHHRSANTKKEVRVKHESNRRHQPSTSQRRSQFGHIENDEEYIRSKGKRSRYY